MVTERPGLIVIDRSLGEVDERIPFELSRDGDGRISMVLETRPYQPGDPLTIWRESLHPWDAGLGRDRIVDARRYRRANGDLSWRGMAVPPPEVVTFEDIGAMTLPSFDWNDLHWIAVGDKLYTMDSSLTIELERDFTSDIAAMTVFNNELIVALGESEFIQKRTAAGSWSTSADVSAIALGVINERLFIAADVNEIKSCGSSPLVLANYTPADPNEYKAGDATRSVLSILEYGGATWAIKADGAYQMSPSFKLVNQNPPQRLWPDPTNGAGAFVAKGYLWVPTVAGLYRVSGSEALQRGPERAMRGYANLRVRSGLEWGGNIWLMCDDASPDGPFLVKMIADEVGFSGADYIYHQVAVLDDDADLTGGFMGVSTLATNPMLVMSWGSVTGYIKLGRGGGRDIDDASYPYGTSFFYESGEFFSGTDMSVESLLIGATVTCSMRKGDALVVDVAADGNGFVRCRQHSDSGGNEQIRDTEGMAAVTMYAPVGLRGQMFNLRLAGSFVDGMLGDDRPEIREIVAIGAHRPRVTDLLSVVVVAGFSEVAGMPTGFTADEIVRMFRAWQDSGALLELELPDYEEARRSRFVVGAVKHEIIAAGPGANSSVDTRGRVTVTFMRVDYTGDYALVAAVY